MKVIIEKIKYDLDTDNKTAAVENPIDNSIEEVIIPEYVEYKNEKYKITEIKEYAFYDCTNLTTINIPDSITSIGHHTFYDCWNLKAITIPDSVTFIRDEAFSYCYSLKSITIPDSVTYIGNGTFLNIGLELPKRYTEDGKLIAYKAFNNDMTCRKFQYEEGKTYEIEGKIKCCFRGFHACTDLLDIFNYYSGEIGKDIYIHEVFLSGDFDEDNGDSKVCASKIEIGRRLKVKDINEIIEINKDKPKLIKLLNKIKKALRLLQK